MIWIRSQDKKILIKATRFEMYVYGSNKNKYKVFCDGMIVGSYKSEEKALKVLDDIQYKINTLEMLRNDYERGLKVLTTKYGLGHIREHANSVFDIPQDEEVEV